MAVDYPKTGVPARMPRGLERNNWPHFMEKKRNEYRSRKVLGRMYDAVEKVDFLPAITDKFDHRILSHDPPRKLMDEVRKIKASYDESMRRIMAQHKIGTEFEVWSTFVLDHSKASSDYKFHEEIGRHSSTLKEQYHEILSQLAGGSAFEHLAPVALAAYHVTHAEVQAALVKLADERTDMVSDSTAELPVTGTSLPFVSFPWVLQDVLGKIAKSNPIQRADKELDAKVDMAVAGVVDRGENTDYWNFVRKQEQASIDKMHEPLVPEPAVIVGVPEPESKGPCTIDATSQQSSGESKSCQSSASSMVGSSVNTVVSGGSMVSGISGEPAVTATAPTVTAMPIDSDKLVDIDDTAAIEPETKKWEQMEKQHFKDPAQMTEKELKEHGFSLDDDENYDY
jgi:hypothetical protein